MEDVLVRDVAASLQRLTHEGLSLGDYLQRLRPVLGRALPHDGSCSMAMDPATWIATAHDAGPEMAGLDAEGLSWNEQGEEDVNKFADLARSRRTAATLEEATAGDNARSARWAAFLGPAGFGSELRGSFVAPSGAWGGVVLLREAGAPAFTPEEAERLHALGPVLAEGVRRAVLLDAASRALTDEVGPGLVVVSEDRQIDMVSAAGRRWLDELVDIGHGVDLPGVVWAVARRALDVVDGGSGPPARAVAPTKGAGWLSLHGSVVEGSAGRKAAVVLQPARPTELAPVIARVHGLTDRERDVAMLVVRGLSTQQIAGRLHLSPWTVQDHLKAVFVKTGVSSRRELVGRVFLQHFVPHYVEGTPLGADGYFAV